MKTWKKLAAFVMALGMTVAMVACGGGNGGDNSSNSSNGGNNASSSEETSGALSKEEITAAKQKAANATNFTVVGTESYVEDGNTVVVTYTRKVAGDKLYMEVEETIDGSTGTYYTYIGKVDDVAYMWMSEDNETWDVVEYDPSMFVDDENPFAALSETDLNYMDDTHTPEYDETNGCHVFTHMNVVVYATITNGDIVKYRFETSVNEWKEYSVSYGNTTVGELPALE